MICVCCSVGGRQLCAPLTAHAEVEARRSKAGCALLDGGEASAGPGNPTAEAAELGDVVKLTDSECGDSKQRRALQVFAAMVNRRRHR